MKHFQVDRQQSRIDAIVECPPQFIDQLLDRVYLAMRVCFNQLKDKGLSSTVMKNHITKLEKLYSQYARRRIDDMPDSGISSTTSIFDEDIKAVTSKRKMDEASPEMDGTFTLSETQTPGKAKAKGAEKMISKGGIGYNFFGGLATEIIHGFFYNINMKRN